MRSSSKPIAAASVAALVLLAEIGLGPQPADAGPPPTRSTTNAQVAHQQTRQDPILNGIRIDVASADQAHRAVQVGASASTALSALSLPRPVPFFAPPAQRTRTLAGVDTWFWVPAASWQPVVRVAAVGKVVVTFVATPVTLQLLPGDGSAPVSCPGPGMPWLRPRTRSLCSHVFQRASTAVPSGRFGGTVQTIWAIRWTSSTGLSGTAGPVIVPTPVSLRVVEAQAVLER